MMAVGSFVTPGINYPVLHRNNSGGLSRHLLLILKIVLKVFEMMAVGTFVTPGINYPVLHRNNSEGLSRHLLFILKIVLTYYLQQLNLIYVQ